MEMHAKILKTNRAKCLVLACLIEAETSAEFTSWANVTNKFQRIQNVVRDACAFTQQLPPTDWNILNELQKEVQAELDCIFCEVESLLCTDR